MQENCFKFWRKNSYLIECWVLIKNEIFPESCWSFWVGFPNLHLTCPVQPIQFSFELTRFFIASWTLSENNSVLWDNFSVRWQKWPLLVQKSLKNKNFPRRYDDSLFSKNYHALMQKCFVFLWFFYSDWFAETAISASRGKNRRRKFFWEESKFQFSF